MEFDHHQAVSSRAVERYLLGELSSPLREEFEDHFFCCPQCAEALRVGVILRDNARALLRAPLPDAAAPVQSSLSEAPARQGLENRPAKQDPEETSLGWRSWFRTPVLAPWAAALLLLIVLVRQQPQTHGGIPDDTTPAAKPAVSVPLLSGVRGPADSGTVTLPPDSIVFLSVDVPADGAYDWSIRSAASLPEAVPLYQGFGKAQNGILAISVDTHRIKPDEYVLSVRQSGLDPSSGRSYSFSLKPSR